MKSLTTVAERSAKSEPWEVTLYRATGRRLKGYNPKDSPEYIAIFGESENSKRTTTPWPGHAKISTATLYCVRLTGPDGATSYLSHRGKTDFAIATARKYSAQWLAGNPGWAAVVALA